MVDVIVIQLLRNLLNIDEFRNFGEFFQNQYCRSLSPVYQFCRRVFSRLQRTQIKK